MMHTYQCLLLLLSVCLPCLAQAPANSPEGSWQGTLGAGTVKLRLVLTLTKSATDIVQNLRLDNQHI